MNAPVVIVVKLVISSTGAFSLNISKLLSELKLGTDNLLFIYAAANCEATETFK